MTSWGRGSFRLRKPPQPAKAEAGEASAEQLDELQDLVRVGELFRMPPGAILLAVNRMAIAIGKVSAPPAVDPFAALNLNAASLSRNDRRTAFLRICGALFQPWFTERQRRELAAPIFGESASRILDFCRRDPAAVVVASEALRNVRRTNVNGCRLLSSSIHQNS